jgi:hypothetical protein
MAPLGIAASAIEPGARSPSIHANSCAKSEAGRMLNGRYQAESLIEFHLSKQINLSI